MKMYPERILLRVGPEEKFWYRYKYAKDILDIIPVHACSSAVAHTSRSHVRTASCIFSVFKTFRPRDVLMVAHLSDHLRITALQFFCKTLMGSDIRAFVSTHMLKVFFQLAVGELSCL
jgi:hypothetical protein